MRLSKPEAEKLAGTPLEDALPGVQACGYTGPITGPIAQVEVTVGDGAKKQLDIARRLGREMLPLPGVGDEAYVDGLNEYVYINKSRLWVSVRLVRLAAAPDYRARLEELARKVATRF